MSFDLLVRRVFGVSGSGESGLFKVSIVRGRLFIIVSVSYIKVFNVLSFRLWSCFFMSVVIMFRIDRICFFYIFLKLFVVAGFLI